MALTFKQEAAIRAMQGLVASTTQDWHPGTLADCAWTIAEAMDNRRKQDEAKCLNYPDEKEVEAA